MSLNYKPRSHNRTVSFPGLAGDDFGSRGEASTGRLRKSPETAHLEQGGISQRLTDLFHRSPASFQDA